MPVNFREMLTYFFTIRKWIPTNLEKLGNNSLKYTMTSSCPLKQTEPNNYSLDR